MKTEILLRAFTAEGVALQEKLKQAIEQHTNMNVVLIDHTNISLKDFDVQLGEVLISIDRHIASKLQIPYFQLSRVFRSDGSVSRRHKCGNINYRGSNVRILDTDIVFGETIKTACEIFKTEKYSAPLRLDTHQDLIDVEDLITNNSLLEIETYVNRHGETKVATPRYHPKRCSYMLNKTFFARRTSLPEELYEVFQRIIGE
jgi:hypothetical protein